MRQRSESVACLDPGRIIAAALADSRVSAEMSRIVKAGIESAMGEELPDQLRVLLTDPAFKEDLLRLMKQYEATLERLLRREMMLEAGRAAGLAATRGK